MDNTQAIAIAYARLLDSITNLTNALTPNDNNKNKPTQPEKDKYLTGKEVDDILKITSVTRHRYANKGLLTRHKVSPKQVLYKQEEVLKLLAASENLQAYV